MLRMTAEVDDVYTNIFHPITTQISAKFVKELDLGKFFNNQYYINSDHSAASGSSDEDGNAKLNDNRFTVDMKYNLNPMSVKWETTTFANVLADGNSLRKIHESKPIYYDHRTQVSITEFTVPADLKLNIKMQFTDRVAANEAISKLHMHFLNGEKLMMNDIEYNFELPEPTQLLMLGLYKLTGQPNEEFLEHLSEFSNSRISTNVNRNDLDGRRQITIKKSLHQCEAEITFDEESSNVEAAEKSADLYTVDCTLTLQFSRVAAMQTVYPVTIYQEMVPGNLLYVDPADRHRAPDLSHPYFSFDRFMRLHKSREDAKHEVVRMPWYDNWAVPNTSALPVLKYREFLSIVLTLDAPEDPNATTTVDLADPAVGLAPQVIDVLRSQGDTSIHFVDAINISVYTNDIPLEPQTELELVNGTELTISTRNPYPVYRVVLSEYIGKPKGDLTRFWVGIYDILVNRIK